MKRLFLLFLTFCLAGTVAFAQSTTKIEGTCGANLKWTFDGYNLDIELTKALTAGTITDYDTKNTAPWTKLKKPIKRVRIGYGVTRIGSCAFANCTELTEVTFDGAFVTEIGWGAFLNCSNLRNITFPRSLSVIETIAFAKCTGLVSISIPDQCRVDDQAFSSCSSLKSIDISPTAILGSQIFVNEVEKDGKVRHTLYKGEVRRLPSYITINTCSKYGISARALEQTFTAASVKDYDAKTSLVDSIIPMTYQQREDLYAIIIGNEDYRFAPDVPYAVHDAHTFADYCEKVVGIPRENMHVTENATKAMILEEELDWAAHLPERESKRLIVYYAGHGVPDIHQSNKSYLLPVDVRGTHPQKGIALEDFYNQLGQMDFAQTTVFLDACFSGTNRNSESVNEGLRGVEVRAEEAPLMMGDLVVFSAAQGNETAQGFDREGHGLFTYYLLRAFQEYGTNSSFGDFFDAVQSSVVKEAPQLRLRKPQTPTASASSNIGEAWRSLSF